jgi:hypothetical protein
MSLEDGAASLHETGTLEVQMVPAWIADAAADDHEVVDPSRNQDRYRPVSKLV